MNKILIVVDMQNDFLTGSLANPDACTIIPNILAEELKDDYEYILFTMDTHDDNYFQTAEGRMLPIKHCIKGTHGQQVVEELTTINKPMGFQLKSTFGSLELAETIKGFDNVSEVTLVGTCTDICVISNAIILKTLLPELTVNVISDCCAGTTPENHAAALKTMKSCQINII